MAEKSKTRNVVNNTMFGIANNVAMVALLLISRKLFLAYIGIDYLSIGQVINNILGILAFTELGITNSVLFMLYKPVAEGNEKKQAAIIGTYKKLNRIVGCVIFGLGLCTMPFLGNIITTSVSMETVYLIFLMNLGYSAATYFCSYRQALINAHQRNDIVSKISLGVNLLSILIQCLEIYYLHDYILYLGITIVMGLLNNIIVYLYAGKMFPFLKRYKNERLNKEDGKVLATNVKSMFSVKICGIAINNTDNILASMIDTLMVGYMSNYTIITARLTMLITIFHNSTVYSLGIASVEKDSEGKYELFKKLVLINTFIGGIAAVLTGVLWDDFIILWIGEEYLISDLIKYAILLNFIKQIITAPVWMFRDTNGLFVYVKRMLMYNTIGNIVLSIALGKIIGISGVFYATVLSSMVTNFWYDSRLVYKKLFDRTDWWKCCLFIVLNVAAVLAGSWALSGLLSIMQPSIFNFFLKAIITACVFTATFLVVYGRTDAMKNIWKNNIKGKLNRKKNK